jgi:type 1 fimbriae regulatory protein FimB
LRPAHNPLNRTKWQNDRKHLTSRQVEKLIEADQGGRHEPRDRCLFLLMLRHGLRVSEACALRLDQA